MCVCMRVCAGECWCWPWQEVLNPSELELQTLVSHVMWVLGKELRSSGRAASPFNLRDFSPAQDMARLLFCCYSRLNCLKARISVCRSSSLLNTVLTYIRYVAQLINRPNNSLYELDSQTILCLVLYSY